MKFRWLYVPLCALLLVPSPAWADEPLEEDALWTAYNQAAIAYEEATNRLDEYDVTTTQGDRLHRQAADRAAELGEAVRTLLESGLALQDDDREALIDTLLTVAQVEGTLRIDVGECDPGRELLRSVLAHPEIAARPLVEERAEEWIARADACIASREMAESPTEESPVAVVLEAPGSPSAGELWRAEPTGGSSGARTGGIVLVSTGAALLVSAVAWDVALSDDVDRFREVRDFCAAGDPRCDTAERGRLRDRIDDAKLPMGALYGVGAAAAITGGVLWLLHRDRGTEPSVDASPTIARGLLGAQLRLRF